MIDKISPNPSFPKRGRENTEINPLDCAKTPNYTFHCIVLFLFFIAPFFISGCKGEKVEPFSPKTETAQTVEAPPAQQVPAGEKSGEVRQEAAEAPQPEKNNLPEIVSIKLSPRLIYPGTRMKAEVEGRDQDGDTITFYYEWKKNGDAIEGAVSDELDTAALKKSDLITVFVTPFDGKQRGKTKWSPTLMITNRPPEITSLPSGSVSNGRYIYEVKANDPDGDVLTFSLEDAPPGMTIDSSTGIIQWDIPAESKDSYTIRVVVSDGDAKAYQAFSLNLKKEIR